MTTTAAPVAIDYPVTRICTRCARAWQQQGPRRNAPKNLAAPMICDLCRAKKSSQGRQSQSHHLLFPLVGNRWRLFALCSGLVGADRLFFPENHDPIKAVRAAKAMCADCPVKAQCLAYALETQQQHGIWGGLAPRERRALSKGRAS